MHLESNNTLSAASAIPPEPPPDTGCPDTLATNVYARYNVLALAHDEAQADLSATRATPPTNILVSNIAPDYVASTELHSGLNHAAKRKVQLTVSQAVDVQTDATRIVAVDCASCKIVKATASGLSKQTPRGDLFEDEEPSTMSSLHVRPSLQCHVQFKCPSLGTFCFNTVDSPLLVASFLTDDDNKSVSDGGEAFDESNPAADTLSTDNFMPALFNGPLTPSADQYGKGRTDLTGLRPFEEVYADIKTLEAKIGGRPRHTLFFVDRMSDLHYKVDIELKTSVGEAMDEFVAMFGLRHLPYQVTVFTDGDGCMKHLRKACHTASIRHFYLIPGEQSINPAESAINRAFINAATMMHFAGLQDMKFQSLAVNYHCYSHARSATTRNRGCVAPITLIGAGPVQLRHIRTFFCPVTVSKASHLRKKSVGDQSRQTVRGVVSSLDMIQLWEGV